MDRFQDGHHVRLRSRVQRTYLHAADDGENFTLSKRRASMNAAWAVHIYHGDDCPYLLLHSAAYGRYLAATATPARLIGHLGLRAELRDYDQSELEAIKWRAVGSGFADDVVLLRNVGGGRGRYLRANGRYLRWNAAVSVDYRASSMMYWVVEPIPAREDMPALPSPPPNPPYGYLLGVLYLEPGRLIRFVRALDDGHYPEDPGHQGWRQFWFRGRSVFRLRDDLGFLVGAGVNYRNIAMCVRAGQHGRLTPLVVDLPHGGYGEILEIVVLRAETPAYNELRHPDVDAE